MEFPHFRSVKFINTSNEGVAKSHRVRKELVINKFYWDKMPEDHKLFILAHEEGHIALNTRDELAADEYASKKYLGAGKSLTQSVKALTSVLQENNPAHILRAWLQYQRALEHDFKNNGNKKTFRDEYESAKSIKTKINEMQRINSEAINVNDYDPFLGIAIGKKARRRKDAKVQAKIANKNSIAESRVILARQGIKQGTAIGDALSGLGQAAASIFGGGMSPEAPQQQQQVFAPEPMPQTYNAPPLVNVPYQNTIGNAQQAIANMPVSAPEFYPEYAAGSGGAYTALPPAAPTEKKENKNLPFIIGGALLVVVLMVFAFKKK